MQDSLEDYIRIIRNSKPDVPNIDKEVQITALRKKDCDIRAIKIVEFAIEGKLIPEIFKRCLPFINKSHYQDIVEERAITKLCGYAICGKKIPEMPKKQFHISTKSNKIFDITDRKNYCSNFCYKASLHVKNQIDDCPLWLRKLEDIPEYQLLESTGGGLPGEYIDQGIVKPVVEPKFTCISIFTEASLSDLVEKEKKKDMEKKDKELKGYKKSSKLLKSTMQTINENTEQVEEEEQTISKEKKKVNNCNKKYHSKQFEHINCKTTLSVIDENEEKLDNKQEEIENSKKSEFTKITVKKSKKKSNAKAQKVEIESLLQKSVKEWFTLETYIFIHGESKVKEVLNEKKLSDYFEELNVTELRRDQQIKYMDICKRLQLQEMADDKFDRALIGNTKLKPLPDYKKLKEENRDLDIKVKCFYGGVLHEKDDTNFPTKTNESKEGSKEDGAPAVLPLVDANSQNALRRKIFLTSIGKSMQQLLQSLRVAYFSSVLSDLQSLVKTFKLRPDNIVFKPIIWNYLAILLLNILSIRDENIKNILEEKHAQEYIDLQMSSLPNKVKLLDEIMTNLQNIGMFVENYISSK